MAYPALKSYLRKLAARELRSVRFTFAYCRQREAAPLQAYETEERRTAVMSDLRAEARAKQDGMRQVMHALFD